MCCAFAPAIRIVVDGAVVGDGVLEMDESLLTSESMRASPIQLSQG
jgi:hypothetical protein